MAQQYEGSFAIPGELAHELSDLLITQTIRERLLDRMIQNDDKAGYERAEELLAPIVEKVEAIKAKITSEYVPDQWRSDAYTWNYNGWEVSRNNIDVLSR